jgi:hypothetical protein
LSVSILFIKETDKILSVAKLRRILQTTKEISLFFLSFLSFLFALYDSSLCIAMVHGALNVSVLAARRQVPGEIERQHIAEIAAVLGYFFVDIAA